MQGVLSADDLNSEYENAFKLFDKDGDGSITRQELGDVIRSLGQNPTEEELCKMITEVDANGNGNIEFNEFRNLMTPQMQGSDAEEAFMAAFNTLDSNKDGFISDSELKQVLSKLGLKLSDDEVKQMIWNGDFNGDGLVSYDELCRIMKAVVGFK